MAQNDARLRFLDQASEALTFSSPAVSSFLRATKQDAISSEELPSQQDFCNACGQALLLGWSCDSVRSSEHGQTRQQRIDGVKAVMKRVRCSACGTEKSMRHQKRAKAKAESASPAPRTKVAAPKVAISKVSDMHKPTPAPAPAPASVPSSKEQTPETAQPKTTARRKGRGKNSSLQAMLANKKTETPKSSRFGLDFMDFMK